MPTNANTFNSRVTSEALEAKFRQVFPAQGGAELVQDLFASGVIQPVVDFSSVAEGSVLPQNLQTAWDFSTGHQTTENATNTLVSNTGFWKIDCTASMLADPTPRLVELRIDNGITYKVIYSFFVPGAGDNNRVAVDSNQMVAFLRSGESLIAYANTTDAVIDVVWRQIADVNGNLVNPLGFTFS